MPSINVGPRRGSGTDLKFVQVSASWGFSGRSQDESTKLVGWKEATKPRDCGLPFGFPLMRPAMKPLFLGYVGGGGGEFISHELSNYHVWLGSNLMKIYGIFAEFSRKTCVVWVGGI